ncbi:MULTISPECIES: hypothetical protein [unclassified Candidatus Cardinium]|uniref:hypothetical protein n=1 Tax=unclassified Candidatus Cardinium TaxID=2641185 RepID=UPI001FB36B46|nr:MULTISPECIES: hypothetical protein [unclassified Candidatus Cardinium]
MGPNIILLIISTFLFGFSLTQCGNTDTHILPKRDTRLLPKILSSKNSAKPILGLVSCLRSDSHLGLVECNMPNQHVVPETRKVGLIFYASKPLVDCAAIDFSSQGVKLTYCDGSIAVLSSFIELDGKLFDAFLKEVAPLSKKNNRLAATYDSDFTIFTAQDYGIKELNSLGNSIVLLENNLDKTKLQDIEHAGFMFTESTRLCTSKLAELIKNLSSHTTQYTSAICAASVAGNSLQPSANPLGHAAYGYIKKGNRYRLMLLNNNTSSTGSQYKRSDVNNNIYSTDSLYKRSDVNRNIILQVDQLKPIKPTEAEIATPDDSKESNETADTRLQTESSLAVEDKNDHHSIPNQTDDIRAPLESIPTVKDDNDANLQSNLTDSGSKYSAYFSDNENLDMLDRPSQKTNITDYHHYICQSFDSDTDEDSYIDDECFTRHDKQYKFDNLYKKCIHSENNVSDEEPWTDEDNDGNTDQDNDNFIYDNYEDQDYFNLDYQDTLYVI